MKHSVALSVNGDTYDVLISPNETLLDVLREKLGLMGTKKGCDLGACGACTVLVDGEAYLSCLMLAVNAAGRKIVTIEGLAQGGELHPLQKAFIEKGGLQGGEAGRCERRRDRQGHRRPEIRHCAQGQG